MGAKPVGASASTQPANRRGQDGVELGVPDRHRTEEEAPIRSVAYHDEDHVVASDLEIRSVNSDFTVDQPSAVTVDAQALAADIGSSRQIWVVHLSRYEAVHQVLDSVLRIAGEAVLTP